MIMSAIKKEQDDAGKERAKAKEEEHAWQRGRS